jgi:hypothetical protein
MQRVCVTKNVLQKVCVTKSKKKEATNVAASQKNCESHEHILIPAVCRQEL